MGFTSLGAKIWPVPPDWKEGVQERLSFSTDVLQASATAVTAHRSLRDVPRRGFTFNVAATDQAHRLVDMLLAGHTGAWQLPIWPDVQWLDSAVPAGADLIPCATGGFDFVAGGQALLYRSINVWELVQIDVIGPDYVALAAPIVGDYGPGCRLYPVRKARLQNGAEAQLRDPGFSRRDLTFDIDEPCAWPGLVDAPSYLGHLVMTRRPAENDDPRSSYSALQQTVDNGTALPFTHNLPGINLRTLQNQWRLHGRDAHTWFRSLVYSLDGRRVPIWMPAWGSRDLQLASAIAGNSTALSIEWAGYTLFGKDKPNRKDLRIELVDGTAFHRRITNSAAAGDTETLTLSAALGPTSIAPEEIESISFMALCTLASDEVEIEHVTDANGVAHATLGWQAVVPDV